MAGYGVTHQLTLLDGASAHSSTNTSNAVLVADANYLSLSIQSRAAVASNWSLQASNSDGLVSALTDQDFSNVSIVAAQGVYSISAGFRFLRVIRPAADSMSTVQLALRST